MYTEGHPILIARVPAPKQRRKRLNPKWSIEEEEKLREFIDKNGTHNWLEASKALKNTKTPRQCRERWRFLDPQYAERINQKHDSQHVKEQHVKGRHWTLEKTLTMFNAVKMYGTGNWTKISEIIEYKDDIQCCDHWWYLLKKVVANKYWTPETMEAFIRTVDEEATKPYFNWDLISIKTRRQLSKEHCEIMYNLFQICSERVGSYETFRRSFRRGDKLRALIHKTLHEPNTGIEENAERLLNNLSAANKELDSANPTPTRASDDFFLKTTPHPSDGEDFCGFTFEF
jgi:hypothetical protein